MNSQLFFLNTSVGIIYKTLYFPWLLGLELPNLSSWPSLEYHWQEPCQGTAPVTPQLQTCKYKKQGGLLGFWIANVLHGSILILSVPEIFTGESEIDLEILVGVPVLSLVFGRRGWESYGIGGQKWPMALLLLSAATWWSSRMVTTAFLLYVRPSLSSKYETPLQFNQAQSTSLLYAMYFHTRRFLQFQCDKLHSRMALISNFRFSNKQLHIFSE